MAEGRQHYIPRFFLKGFASRVNRKASTDYVYAWLYEKGPRAYEANINNVASENEFYDDDDYVGLDDSLGELESGYGVCIARLREGGPQADVDSSEAGRLLEFLYLRAKHIRDAFSLSMGPLFDQLVSLFSSEDNIDSLVGLFLEKMGSDDRFARRFVYPELAKAGVPEDLWGLLMKAIRSDNAKLRVHLRGLVRLLPNILQEQLRGHALVDKLHSSIKLGHVRGMKTRMEGKGIDYGFGSLHYRIMNVSDGPLPLGDSVVVFHAGGRYTGLLNESGDVYDYLFLPISSTQVLIGYRESMPVLSYEELARQIVACSLKRFYAARNDEWLYSLAPEIGMSNEAFRKGLLLDILFHELMESLLAEN